MYTIALLGVWTIVDISFTKAGDTHQTLFAGEGISASWGNFLENTKNQGSIMNSLLLAKRWPPLILPAFVTVGFVRGLESAWKSVVIVAGQKKNAKRTIGKLCWFYAMDVFSLGFSKDLVAY